MLPLMPTSKKQTFPGAQVHCTEDDTMSVPARDENTGWFAASAPVGAQWGKKKQIGLVFHQQHAARRQMPDSAANSSFFSRALDPAPTHSGAASTRNQVGSTHGVLCGPKTVCRRTFPRDPAAAAPSSSRRNNRVLRESVSKSFVATPNIPQSTPEVAPNGLHQATTQDPTIPGIDRSSGRYWAGSHATSARSPSPIVPDHIPKWRASVDTTEHLANSSVAFPIDDARGMTNAMLSQKYPRLSTEQIRVGNRV